MDAIDKIVSAALAEDIGAGDLTTRLVIPPQVMGRGIILAKSDMIVAGIDTVCRTFKMVDPKIDIDVKFNDGEKLKSGAIILVVRGRLRSLLEAERTALNFLQRASGIATLTSRFAAKVKNSKAKILDTRKTAPGLRLLDKAAVRAGGGFNHRMGLFDAILIKDNHIASAGGVTEAIGRAKAAAPHLARIEVEVTDLDELDEAIEARADVIMLDNMSIKKIAEAVKRIDGRALIEVSGNVSLDTAAQIARTGVDFISVGALTHSAAAADISMEIEKE